MKADEDNLMFLDHIAGALENILNYTSGFNEEKFYNNKLVQDGTIRNFEIAGEATKRLSNDFREKQNHIPWKKLSAFRDLLIHGYAEVDTVFSHTPHLLKQIRELINQLENEN
jgi:uncharacterized protein with HEPN domain